MLTLMLFDCSPSSTIPSESTKVTTTNTENVGLNLPPNITANCSGFRTDNSICFTKRVLITRTVRPKPTSRFRLVGMPTALTLGGLAFALTQERLCTAAAKRPDILNWADGRAGFQSYRNRDHGVGNRHEEAGKAIANRKKTPSEIVCCFGVLLTPSASGPRNGSDTAGGRRQRASSSSWRLTSRMPAGLHHHDPIGQRQNGQAVRNENRGPVAGELFQHLLDRLFALQIDLAGGLVEDQDGRIAEDGPGQGDALPLAAGEAIAQRPGLRLVAFGQFLFDEAMGVGLLGGLDHLLARGVGPP